METRASSRITGMDDWPRGLAVDAGDRLLTQESAVSLEKIAERLWVRMVQGSLLEGRTSSRSSSGH
jgi:hypothetical protein